MRMRKLPWAEDFMKEQEIVIKHPKSYAGSWKQYVKRDCLHIEIGTGKGDYWIGMAQLYPQYGWIGIEKNVNVAALAVRKYSELQPQEHMLYINDDAENIMEWFAQGEVDVIHLNFSDPWPKKRTHKKRLSNHKFIKQYEYILKDDGEIQMKTDNSSLFEYSILEFQRQGWYLHDVSVDFRRVIHDEDVISEYERRFMNLGQPIYRAIWKKVALKKED